jgi:hypothetical protein
MTPNNIISPEFRLLLACTLPPSDVAEIEHLRQSAAACVDWEAFLKLANRHQLTLLAGQHLQQHAADLVSPDILAQIGEYRAANKRRTVFMALELAEIGQIWAKEGIPLCPLKGPWLAERLYGSPSLRLSSDLDVLVAPERVLDAEAALLANGYRRTEPAAALSPRQWEMCREVVIHSLYAHPKRKYSIELHWGVATPDVLPLSVTNQALKRARPAAFAGQAIVDLDNEDLLAFLLIHGARHLWCDLKWLADIAMLLRQSPNLELVQQRLKEHHLERFLALGVLLCYQWFGIPISHLLEPATRDKVVAWAAQVSAQHILEPESIKSGNLDRFQGRWFWARLQSDSIFAKLKILWHSWFIPTDWVEFPLPDWLFPVYIFLRPILWLRRYHLSRWKKWKAPINPQS